MSGDSTNEWLRYLFCGIERMIDFEAAAALGERAGHSDLAEKEAGEAVQVFADDAGESGWVADVKTP